MEEQLQPTDWAYYKQVIARHKSFILAFCISASISALALTYIFSEKYVATTTILYRPKEAIRFEPKQAQALGFPTPFVTYESIGNTLEELAISEVVTEKVVQTLHLDQPEQNEVHGLMGLLKGAKREVKKIAGNAWEILKYGRILDKDPYVAAVRGLQKNIQVKPTKKAYTFDIYAMDNNPQRAAIIVDTEAKVLSDLLSSGTVNNARQESQQLEERLEANGKDLDAARNALKQFKKRHNVAALSEEITLQLKGQATLQDEIAKTQVDLHGMELKLQQLRNQLGQQPEFVKYTTTDTDNPVVQDLNLERARLEVQRSGLLEKLTPDHPDVKSLDAKLDEINKKLKTEELKITSATSMRLNDVHEKLLMEAVATQVDVDANRGRIQSLEKEINRSRQDLAGLSGSEATVADLTMRVESSERAYKLLSDAYEEAKIAETKTSSEVQILNAALVPNAPVRPIKILHVTASALTSIVLALGFVFFLNYLDPSVRNVEDAKRILRMPVLSTIPSVQVEGLRWDYCLEPRRTAQR